MRLLMVILSVGTQLFCFSQGLNQKDKNGKKTGYRVIRGNISAHQEYSNTSKVEEGNYNQSRKTEIWIKYWPNGNAKKLEYVNGRVAGKDITYFENGEIEEGKWNEDSKHPN